MEELAVRYERRFRGEEEKRVEVWRVLVRHFFQRWIAREQAVLDLGAGYCEFINTVQAGRKYALDLNPLTPQKAAPGVCVLAQGAAEPWAVPASSLDVVFTSNFFEHLPDKAGLKLCLEQSFLALRPGGILIAMGPNIRFCSKVYWDFSDHHIPLSDRSLTEIMGIVGYEIVKVFPRFLPFTMAGRPAPPSVLVRSYLAFRPAWRLLGKQFLIIARKPGKLAA
jgi:SAM-dependent methyltransferase